MDDENAICEFIKHRETVQVLVFDIIMPKKNDGEDCEEILKIKGKLARPRNTELPR